MGIVFSLVSYMMVLLLASIFIVIVLIQSDYPFSLLMPLKVIFMGTPDFTLPFLKNLTEDPDMQVQAVVTQEDEKVGRKQELSPPPVKTFAQTLSLPVLQPEKLRHNSGFIGLIHDMAPDFIVVVAYGKILPKELLDIPKYGCINFHPSLLPRYRGATPMETALLNGDTETGISFIKMEEKMDGGPVYFVKKIPIEPEDNAVSLRLKLFLLGASLITDLLRQIRDGELQPIRQNEGAASYCHKIEREDGLIDPEKLTALEIRNRMRAYTPWPQCYLVIKGKRLKILEADIDLTDRTSPGIWKELAQAKIALGTRTGSLIPMKVQLEGKSPMPIDVFLRGNRDWLLSQ